MYADYPISRKLLHWESQANTAQHHTSGQNLIHHQERGYTVLVFARGQKKRSNVTVTFPRNCGQSEKLLQQSTEDCHGIKEKTLYPRVQS